MIQDRSALLESIRAGIERMPWNRLLSVRLVSMADGRARAEVAARPELLNHVGGVHVSVQHAAVEAAGAAAVSSALLELLGTATPLARGVELTWHHAAQGDIRAEAEVVADDARRVAQEVALLGRSRLEVAVRVVDATGTLVADAVTRWSVRSNR